MGTLRSLIGTEIIWRCLGGKSEVARRASAKEEWIFWLGRTSTNALAEAHAVGRRARKQHRIG